MTRISELLEKKDNLNLIKTNKYKDITLAFKFAFPYSRKKKVNLFLLALMMDTSEKYDTKEKMAKAKSMLYGLSYIAAPSVLANLCTFTITYEFINPKFLNDIEEKDYIDFIDETLKHPNFTENLLTEVKRNAKDSIERNYDVPSNLASENFYAEASKDDARFEAYSTNFVDDFKDVTLQDIEETYQSLFETRLDIYLIGDYSKALSDYISNYHSKIDLHSNIYPVKTDRQEELSIQKDVGQSTLIVTYKTPYTRTSKEFYAFNLANIMFGGIPTSLLFQEVREKHSLCYAISARSLRYEGLVMVKTLIDAKNKEEALLEIRKQFTRMQNLDFDESLLATAKMMLINNSLSIDDDLDYLIDYNYSGEINNTYLKIDDYIAEVEKVTIADIKEVFSHYQEYLVYFLEGTKHEENI